MDTSPPVYERAEPAPLKPRRKPPVGRRFPPGTSGNPAGRPRRASTPSTPAALERAMKGRVTVETGGRPRRLSVTEALIQSMIDRALTGDTSARRDLLKAKAELDAAAAARREAARLAREAKARAEAEAAERVAIAADKEPTFPVGWNCDEFLSALQSWNVCVKREGRFYLRQWVASAGLLQRGPASEDYAWPWRPAVDPVGENRSMREERELQTAIEAGEITEAQAPRWLGGRLYGEGWEGGDEAEGADDSDAEQARAHNGETPESASGRPSEIAPPVEPPEPPLSPEEDWIERLARVRPRGRDDWMG